LRIGLPEELQFIINNSGSKLDVDGVKIKLVRLMNVKGWCEGKMYVWENKQVVNRLWHPLRLSKLLPELVHETLSFMVETGKDCPDTDRVIYATEIIENDR